MVYQPTAKAHPVAYIRKGPTLCIGPIGQVRRKVFHPDGCPSPTNTRTLLLRQAAHIRSSSAAGS